MTPSRTRPGLHANANPQSAQVIGDVLVVKRDGVRILAQRGRIQAPRVAETRGLPVDEVLALVDRHTSGRVLGFLGEPGVKVLDLNLALDEAR